MLRSVIRAAIVAASIVTAAPLMAQQPAPAPMAPQRSFVARPHRAWAGGPRRHLRRFRHGRRGRMMMRRMRMRRMGMRPGAMRTRYYNHRAMI